jgi:hypothetical protein
MNEKSLRQESSVIMAVNLMQTCQRKSNPGMDPDGYVQSPFLNKYSQVLTAQNPNISCFYHAKGHE